MAVRFLLNLGGKSNLEISWNTVPPAAKSPSRNVSSAPSDSIGRFRAVRQLGEGGFGFVWEVEDPLRPGLRLALKCLHRSATPTTAEPESGSFTDEFRVAATIQHPSIVRALETGLIEDPRGEIRPYLLSEFCEGTPFAPTPRWTATELSPVAKEILEALSVIHTSGWRHGDIQPKNIIVERGAGRARTHLLDFGLADSEPSDGVRASTAGTAKYLAPEILRGFQPDYRSDLYSLGVVLFECLHGAIESPLADHLLATRQGKFFESTCRIPTEAPFDRVLSRLLDPDPAARAQTADDAIELLRQDSTDATRLSDSPPRVSSFESPSPVGFEEILENLSEALDDGYPSGSAPRLLFVEAAHGLGKTRLCREASIESFCRNRRAVEWPQVRSAIRGDRSCADLDETLHSPPLWAESAWKFLQTSRSTLIIDDIDDLPEVERTAARLLIERLAASIVESRRNKTDHLHTIVVTGSAGVLTTAEFGAWWDRISKHAWVRQHVLMPWSEAQVLDFLTRTLRPARDLGPIEESLVQAGEGSPRRIRALLTELARRRELRLSGGTWRCERDPSQGLPTLPDERDSFRAAWRHLDESARHLLGVIAVWSNELEGIPRAEADRALKSRASELEEVISRVRQYPDLGLVDHHSTRRLLLPRRQRIFAKRESGSTTIATLRRQVADTTSDPAETLFQRAHIEFIPAAELVSSPAAASDLLIRTLAVHTKNARRNPAIDRTETALLLGQQLQARGEFTRASFWLELTRCEDANETSQRDACLHLAELTVARGKAMKARTLAREALSLVVTDSQKRARAVAVLGQCELLLGDAAMATSLAREALEDSPTEVRLWSLLANASLANGELESSEDAFTRGLEEAEKQGRQDAKAALHSNLGRLHQARGEHASAIDCQREAAQAFIESGRLAQASRGLSNLAVNLRRSGEYEDAADALEKSLQLAQQAGAEEEILIAEANSAILARELGLWGASKRRFRDIEKRIEHLAPEFRRTVLESPAYVASRALLSFETRSPDADTALKRARELLGEEVVESLLPERISIEIAYARQAEGQRLETLALDLTRRAWTETDCDSLFRLCGSLLPRLDAADATREPNSFEVQLERLAKISQRAGFFHALHTSRKQPKLEEELAASLEEATTHHAPRNDRIAALTVLATRSENAETRARARAALRRDVDALLLDLSPAQRDSVRRAPLFLEAQEVIERFEPSSRAALQSPESLKDILRFNRAILEESSVDSLLRRIVDAAVVLTGATRGFLAMRRSGRLRFLASRSDCQDLASPEEQISHTVLEKTFRDGAAQIATDARKDVDLRSIASVEELGLRSVICVPMELRHPKSTAVLYLDNTFEEGVFGTDELELAESFCAQAALAWDIAGKRQEIEALVSNLKDANQRLQEEVEQSKRESVRKLQQDTGQVEGIVGSSPQMRRLFHTVSVVAPTEIPVLITGESGTGKELVARAIHQQSARSEGPFVAENCGAIPATLLESTLFGHAKGAFTGAERDRVGLFSLADGGTLFLDEIGELPIDLQTRLLRALQEGEVRPLGSQKTSRVNVRIVAATNRDVREAMRAGTFREDLYFRLQGAEIDVPPLRDRPDDIPNLVEHFLEKFCPSQQRKTLHPEALQRLCRSDWPGNVRELENEIRRLALMCPVNVIGMQYLSPAIRESSPSRRALPTEGSREIRTLQAVEQDAILHAMEAHSDHRGKVAKALGISRSTLYLKLKQIGFKDS